MKKWFATLSLVLTTALLKAQKVAETVNEEVPTNQSWFSDNTKWTMLYVFSAVLILLVLRTFRNKPEV